MGETIELTDIFYKVFETMGKIYKNAITVTGPRIHSLTINVYYC